MKKLNFDTISFAVGLVTSLLIFVSQGPYDSIEKTLLPFIPLGFVFAFLTIKKIFTLFYNSKTKYLLEELKFIKSTKTNANWTLRVDNINGDLNVFKTHRITLYTNDIIKKTTGEIIYSIHKLENLPPDVKVEKSNRIDRKVTKQPVIKSVEKIGGIDNNRYKWRYVIDPPLNKKGDYVEYSYQYDMPEELKNAFTKNGDIIILEQKSFWQDTNLTFIAPTSFKIEIMEFYIEDYNGDKQEIANQTSKPKLNSGDSVLEWKTEFIRFSRYICKIKLIQK